MKERLTPPDWDAYDHNMLINVGDMKFYYENFTEAVDLQATANKNAITTLDGRVAALEHSIPVGPGGDGAYLHLGGTPERYPTAEEMVAGDSKEETSFMVIARPDGIYFYNPKTKVVIPPKKGGGTIAVHGQFPQVFDAGHAMSHDGRQNLSGVYTAKSADIGLGGVFTTYENCKLLVVVNDNGEEYQTAFSPDGVASRIFRNGSFNASWGFASGGGGGSGGVDPIVIQEIKDRLDALEAHDHIDKITELSDVVLDPVSDVDGILYMDSTGKIRGGSTNPMLGMGYAHVHTNSVGSHPYVAESNVGSTITASHNTVIIKGSTARQVTLPSVVAYNTYKPTTTEVREGRTTLIANMSSAEVTVKVPSGGRFYVEGSMTSTDAIIPARTVYVYQPAILDNGSGAMMECWIYLGNYPLRASDLSGLTQEIADVKASVESLVNGLKNGTSLIDAKAVSSQVYVGWNTVGIADSAKYEHFIFWGNSTNRGVDLPDIVANDTDTLSSGEVRVGRTITITNRSATNKYVKPATGCTFWRSDTNADGGQFNLAANRNVILTAWIKDGSKYWVVVGSHDVLDESSSANLQTGLTGGGQLVNWNALGADPVSTSGDVTAANMASCPFVVGMGSVTGKKFIMAEIADRTVTSLTSTQVREGRTTYLVNMSSVTRSVELTGGCKFNMTGSNVTTKQTIPAKTVWVFVPGIYSNGDKVWTFTGSFSAETIDFKDLVNRVAALEAGGGPGSGGVTELTGLTDTPTSYTGHKNKFLAVKDDESGVEFVVTPSIDVRPIEDRLDMLDQNIAGHVADFELMRDGHIPTSWNGLGARPITSSNDITVADIAESPFVIGTGTVTGKRFILPDIAELGVMSLGADQVREGRATYLVNLGNVDRIIEVTAGCKINVTGGATSVSQTIPRKTVWMMSPGVFAGDKVWTFLGSMSSESLDIAALVDRLEDVENRPLIEKFTDLADTPADYRPGQVLRYNQAGDGIVSSELSFKNLTDTPSDYTGNKNKMLVVNNGETAIEFKDVPDLSGLQSDIDDNYNNIIALQNMDTVIGNNVSSLDTRVTTLENAPAPVGNFVGLSDTPNSLEAKKYLVVNDAGDAVVHSTLTTDDTAGLAALAQGSSTGNVLLHQNCLGGPTVLSGEQIISGTLVSQSAMILVAAWQNNSYVNMPKIVHHETSPLPADSVRAGRVTSIYNRSTNSKTIIVRPDPSWTATIKMKDKNYNNITNFSLAPGRVAKFTPLIDAGVQYWALIEEYQF